MPKKKGSIALPLDKEEIIKDYRLAYQSRQASLIGRREVLSGKAKFGIFGDGKEIAQLAIARAFKKGDWRSGYYRDQTWMFMLGVMSIQEFFAQLYSHADVTYDPASAAGTTESEGQVCFDAPEGVGVDLVSYVSGVDPTRLTLTAPGLCLDESTCGAVTLYTAAACEPTKTPLSLATRTLGWADPGRQGATLSATA